MWRSRDVVRLLEWLRGHNMDRPVHQQVGLYGLDLYSLHRSIEAVLAYLGTVDPPAAERARARYACLDVFGRDMQA
jgi:erythromycin esterase-like protein